MARAISILIAGGYLALEIVWGDGRSVIGMIQPILVSMALIWFPEEICAVRPMRWLMSSRADPPRLVAIMGWVLLLLPVGQVLVMWSLWPYVR